MVKKLIWTFVILLVLLIAGGLILSWYASRAVETNLRQSLTSSVDGQYDVQFESVKLNALSSVFTVRGLTLFDRESSTQVSFSSLSYNLPYAEWLQIARTPTHNAVNVIEEGTVRARNMMVYSEPMDMTMFMTAGDIHFVGNLGDLIRSVSLGQAPGIHQEIDVEIRSVSAGRGDDMLLTGARTAPQIDRISGKITYDPTDGRMNFDGFRVSSPVLTTDINGEIIFTEKQTGIRPDMDTDFEFIMRTRGSRISVGGDDAGFNFRRMQINLNGMIPGEATARELLDDNDVSLALSAEQFQFFPPRSFRQGSGRNLSMMGASTENIIIPGIDGKFSMGNERLNFDLFEIDTQFGKINVFGGLLLNASDYSESAWDRARIVMTPSTVESGNLIATFSGFFGLNLQRENGNFILPLTGTLSDPRIEGIN